MNRLAPLIVRRPQPVPCTAFRSAAPGGFQIERADERPRRWLEDVRFFLACWAAGLVAFGTFLS